MANNTYYVEDLVDGGKTVDVTDDGTGSDWIAFRNTYTEPTEIRLSWDTDSTTGASISAEALYFIGNDGSRLIVHGRIENARGSNGVDYIAGNEFDNILYGDALDNGVGGDDTINGGDGNDRIYGGAGSDSIGGTGGNDTVYGGLGNDTLDGGDGLDLILGRKGADVIDGGSDLGDILSYKTSAAGVRVVMSYGEDTTGHGGDAEGDTIRGFTNVIGSAHDDVIRDASANPVGFDYNKNDFNGGSGNDTLVLGGGNDTGKGGSGTDTLTGGLGADHLSGNGGADMFIYRALADSTVGKAGRDTISDFSHQQGDQIDLALIDANTHRRGNQVFDFIGTHAFSGHGGELRIQASGNGFIVSGDVDGDKRAEFSILVDHVANLRASDFDL